MKYILVPILILSLNLNSVCFAASKASKNFGVYLESGDTKFTILTDYNDYGTVEMKLTMDEIVEDWQIAASGGVISGLTLRFTPNDGTEIKEMKFKDITLKSGENINTKYLEYHVKPEDFSKFKTFFDVNAGNLEIKINPIIAADSKTREKVKNYYTSGEFIDDARKLAPENAKKFEERYAEIEANSIPSHKWTETERKLIDNIKVPETYYVKKKDISTTYKVKKGHIPAAKDLLKKKNVLRISLQDGNYVLWLVSAKRIAPEYNAKDELIGFVRIVPNAVAGRPRYFLEYKISTEDKRLSELKHVMYKDAYGKFLYSYPNEKLEAAVVDGKWFVFNDLEVPFVSADKKALIKNPNLLERVN